MFKMFTKEESGATLIEYGVAMILAIIVGGGFLTAIGDQTDDTMQVGQTTLQQR